jgi:hypothetical protein
MTRSNITNAQAKWLEEALRHSRMTKAELARRVSGILGIDYDRKRLSKLGKELQKLSYEEISAISTVTGFPPPAFDREMRLNSSSEEKTGAVPIESFLAFAEAAAMERGLDSEAARKFAKVALESALRPPDRRVAAPDLEQARLRALDVLAQFPFPKDRK